MLYSLYNKKLSKNCFVFYLYAHNTTHNDNMHASYLGMAVVASGKADVQKMIIQFPSRRRSRSHNIYFTCSLH